MDTIHIPSIRQYEKAEEYYSTAYHESIHSTGIKTRLDRAGLQDVHFGSDVYSREELVAKSVLSVFFILFRWKARNV